VESEKTGGLWEVGGTRGSGSGFGLPAVVVRQVYLAQCRVDV